MLEKDVNGNVAADTAVKLPNPKVVDVENDVKAPLSTIAETVHESFQFSLPKREIKFAELHAAPFLGGNNGVGQLKTSIGPAVYTGMKLWYDGFTLEAEYKGLKFGVPAANVKSFIYK